MIDGSQHLGMGNGTLDFWGFMDWRIYVGLWTDRDSESWGSGCMGLGDPEFREFRSSELGHVGMSGFQSAFAKPW